MAPGPETRLVGRIVKAITEAYPAGWVVKVHGGPYQTAGIPDLLALIEGNLFGLEVKHLKPGESEERARARATMRQTITLDKIRQAGGTAAVILSPGEALAIIEQTLTKRD